MKTIWFFALLALMAIPPMIGRGEASKDAELPTGFESFFPKGYTRPRMAVGGNTVAIVGPTPVFAKKDVQGAKTDVENVQTSRDGADDHQADAQLLENGNTPLMLASTRGDLEAVKGILSRGGNINTKNKFGSTALMGAAAGGYKMIVELLLKKGASVNVRGKGGFTALSFAKKNGHDEIAELLVKAGAKDDSPKEKSSVSNPKKSS